VSATDRTTKVIIIEDAPFFSVEDGGAAANVGQAREPDLREAKDDVQTAWAEALQTLRDGHLLAVQSRS